MSRKRNWCFTLNNPTADARANWTELPDPWKSRIVYAVFQEELSESGTIHLQGYVEFKAKIRLSRLLSLFGTGYHWEPRRGTQEEARAYCMKAETRVDGGLSGSHGRPKRSGAGGDLGQAVLAIKEGMEIWDVMDQFPEQYVNFGDKLRGYALELKGKRIWPMEIEIFVGTTGTGKSYTAHSENPNAYSAPWPTGGRWWWPKYEGEEVVILDEFCHQIKISVMMTMFDRYSWKIESKGNNFEFVSKKIVITTNLDPKMWFPNVKKSSKDPLARRIREFATIWDFTGIDRDGRGPRHPHWVKTMRSDPFEFNDTVATMTNYGRGF